MARAVSLGIYSFKMAFRVVHEIAAMGFLLPCEGHGSVTGWVRQFPPGLSLG